MKTLLRNLAVDMTDLCLHRLNNQFKSRGAIRINDDEIDLTKAFNFLKNNIIPVLEFIKQGTTPTNVNNAFSDKVKDFIWFLYHPYDSGEYSSIKNYVFVFFHNEILSASWKPKSIKLPRLNKLFFPIRPDFKDSKSLLGYYNPLSNVYQSTELLDFILEAQKEYVTNGKSASPYLVLFDEMNLARVEYYFADFLSVLESKRVQEESVVDAEMFKYVGVTRDKLIGFYSKPILLHDENNQNIKIPQKLYLPPNLYFVGSVNIDETTHMFSPKVLDRAFTIEFDADMNMYVQGIGEQQGDKKCCIEKQDTKTSETKEETNEHNEDAEKTEDVQTASQKDSDDTSKQSATTSNQKDAQCFELTDFIRWGEFAIINKDCVREIAGYEFQSKTKNQSKKPYQDILNEIFSILKPYGLHFGYRVFDEIMMFMCNATVATKDDYKMTDMEAFDLAIKMKILPKFHGTRQKLETPIKRLIGYCENADSANEQKTQDYLSPKSIPILTTSSQHGNVLKVKLDDKDYDFLFPHTARKLIEMLYKLQTQGFAGFM